MSTHPDNARRACDGTILGTLLKSAAEKGLYPPPRPPYEGLTFGDVAFNIMALKISSLCDYKYKYPGQNESHGVSKALSSQAAALYDKLPGLSLSSFN